MNKTKERWNGTKIVRNDGTEQEKDKETELKRKRILRRNGEVEQLKGRGKENDGAELNKETVERKRIKRRNGTEQDENKGTTERNGATPSMHKGTTERKRSITKTKTERNRT